MALSCCPAVQPNPLTKEWGQRNAGLNPEIIVCPCAFVIRNFFVRLQLRVLGLLKFGYWNFSDAWLLEFGIFQIVGARAANLYPPTATARAPESVPHKIGDG
jgi:hypothetical protein